jgi:hypothetical protein
MLLESTLTITMSELATEIVYLSLKPNLDLDTNATWATILTTIAQQPGIKAVYWGRQIEHPDTVQMVVGKATPCNPSSPSSHD